MASESEFLGGIAPTDEIREAAAFPSHFEPLLLLHVVHGQRVVGRSAGAGGHLVEGIEAVTARLAEHGAGLRVEEEHLGVTHDNLVLASDLGLVRRDHVLLPRLQLHEVITIVGILLFVLAGDVVAPAEVHQLFFPGHIPVSLVMDFLLDALGIGDFHRGFLQIVIEVEIEIGRASCRERV